MIKERIGNKYESGCYEVLNECHRDGDIEFIGHIERQRHTDKQRGGERQLDRES